MESEQRAREVINYRESVSMREKSEQQSEVVEELRKVERQNYVDTRQARMKTGYFKTNYGNTGRTRETAEDSGQPTVNILVKGDVDGSIDAILSCLETYQEEEVLLDIVNFGVGQVSESDVAMAESFDAIIYAFNTTVPAKVQKQADGVKVPIRGFNVIYHLIGDLKQEITSKMPQLEVEDVIGRANVLQEFQIKDKKTLVSVAGSRVVNGKISRSATVKVMRGVECVYHGDLLSLKHLKDEVSEIVQNQGQR